MSNTLSVPENLKRFYLAQNTGTPNFHEKAVAELFSGCKKSHWIWFVLPQLLGLGHSEKSKKFGINDLLEAQEYLENKLLKDRLEEIITVIAEQLKIPEQSLTNLMGSELDAIKTISSLTLFEAAGLEIASMLLDQLGTRCPMTQELLRSRGNVLPRADA
ncbi:DUF1810 family protein [Prochlorococcus sp. MIT 1341]|uniref:DUF1810 family protein n=1 Tax=Prochlorococcus sp. MIT 1341 TaxID=3096221 RepID=UPI002A7587CE|nr:DUF1810 family protein [Prochlorococcus sp. MIT 1341]